MCRAGDGGDTCCNCIYMLSAVGRGLDGWCLIGGVDCSGFKICMDMGVIAGVFSKLGLFAIALKRQIRLTIRKFSIKSI